MSTAVKGYIVRLLVSLLCLFCAPLFSQGPVFSYPLYFNVRTAPAQDDEHIPGSFRLVGFSCVPELKSFESELVTITGFIPGVIMTRERFLQAVQRLSQKNCFSEGEIQFFQEQEGTRLVFKATRLWLLRSIKIKGVSSDKNEFRRLYEQEVGEPFSRERHEASMKKLQQYVADSGYHEAQVTSEVSLDEQTKTVVVTIKINRRKVATIVDAQIELEDAQHLLAAEELVSVQRKIKKMLCKKFFAQSLMEKMVGEIKGCLKELGFWHFSVSFDQQVSGTKKVTILLRIALHDRKKTFFFGNRFFSQKELRRKIADLSTPDFFLPSLIAAQELCSDYEKKGFWNVSIDMLDDGPGREYFVIKEGPRCVIKAVMVRGVEFCQPGYLERKFFKKLTRLTSFDQQAVDDAIAECIAWYKKRGFWDAKITKREYVPLADTLQQYSLALTIEEGKQRLLTGIDVLHFPISFAALPFYEELQKASGSLPLPSDGIAAQKTFLLKKLREAGYLHSRVSYHVDEQPGGLRIVWRCQKGPQVSFGKTVVQGVTKIPYERLLKLLDYREGEIWNKDKVQNSLMALRGLDIFERVSLRSSFKDASPSEQDVILMIKDDDPFEVKVRMGFAQVSKNLYFKKGSTYKAGGSFIWKNPRARADRFAIDVDYNRFEKRINVSYKVPFLFDKPIGTVFKVYANKYIQPVYIGSSKPLYQVLQQGFLMGLSKKTHHCDLGLTSGIDWMETNDLSKELAVAINFKTDLVDKKIPYVFIEPMVYANFLNDPMNPTQGFFGLATIKGMFPLKKSSFLIKVFAEQGTFIPLSSTVLGIRFRAGHIFRQEFSAVMPPERFYLGGPFSLRSYPQDHCPPLGVYDDGGTVQYVPQGGKTMFNANFEWRLPFHEQTVWGAAFQDFGILVEDMTASPIISSHPLAATGFGFRYLTPVGPLRFDIGWKWRKERPEEPAYAWFLIFGNAF